MESQVKILVLAANPPMDDQAPLRVSAEIREIEEALQRSKYRDRFKLIPKLAARAEDWRQGLLAHKPQIVHFAGHGIGKLGLVMETDSGEEQIVRTEALAQLFSIFSTGEIECVVLNACYAEEQAKVIHQFVDCVIGMNAPIGDKASQAFSVGFYEALGAGKLYDEAFELGRSAISLTGSRDQAVPVQWYRKRHDAIAPALSIEQSSPSPEPVPTAPSVPAGQSQTVGNISISGSDNAFNVVQGAGDVNIDQSRTQTTVTNPDLQSALEALGNLKQAIASTDELSGTDKKMAAIPMEELEAELQKPEPQQSVINQALASLNNALDKASSLAGPVTEVAKLVAKVGVLLI